MAHRVSFRPEAEADLIALYNYIAEAAGHKRAGEYIDRIEAASMNLATFPMRGTPRDDLAPGLRSLSFERRAVILFCLDDDTVRIVRVFYAGRDYEALYQQPDEDT